VVSIAFNAAEARLEPFAVYAHAWVSEARDALALGELKARSVTDREGVLRRYVLPEFADRPVGTISTTVAREFRSALIARGLAPATVKGAFDAFRRVLEMAVEAGAIPSNPAVLRRKPGRNTTRYATGFEHHPLSKTQLGAVVAEAQSTPDSAADHNALVILFLAYSGVRAGELSGLEVGDLTFRAASGTVRVERTKRKIGGRWAVDTPKSRKSTRRVPLPAWLAERLRDYLTEDHPNSADPEAPLFPGRLPGGYTHGANRKNPDAAAPGRLDWSQPVEPSLLYRNVLKPALLAAGLPVSAPATESGHAVRGVRLHDLRHLRHDGAG
jgi:integrase